MLSKDRLLAVKKIVAHKHCSDGTSSAMIIHDVLPDAEIFFAGYGDEEYENLEATEGLLFCDIGPPKGRHTEFLKAGSLVLDHHISIRNIVEMFDSATLGVYGDTDAGESGATLALKYVWEPLSDRARTPADKVRRLALLAGVRDTWQKDSEHWDDSIIQQNVLGFYPAEHFLEDHLAEVTDEELKIGKLLLERHKSSLKKAVNNAIRFEFKGLKFAILSGGRIISDASESLRADGVNVCFSFSFSTNNISEPVMNCSMRSDGKLNCSKFAERLGGGGHLKAAGFRLPVIVSSFSDASQNPYDEIKSAIWKFGEEFIIKS